MSQPEVGGIVAFSGKDWQCDLINICSLGMPRVSIHHVGILGSLHQQLLLYESKGMGDAESPCIRTGKPVNGVQAHALQDVLDNAKKTKIWYYPLRCKLYRHEQERLEYFLDSCLGIRYDLNGALKSGGFLTRQIVARLKDEDLNTLFCSEFVADALVEIGIFRTNNISKWSPNRLVRNLLANGVIGKPTLLKDC